MTEDYQGSDKIDRVLGIYSKLMNGYIVNKAEEAQNYGVNERSIQRDIEDIRSYMDKESTETGTINTVVYDRINKGYRLEQIFDMKLSNSEILAICKILLDSRAFTKKEMTGMLSRLIDCCVPRGDLWSKQMLKLYSDKIVGKGFELGKEKTKDLSIFEQFKFFKYRYYLLTDCLFIRCFDDKKKGQKLVEDVIEFYGERYRRKLECLCEAFYSTEPKDFLRDFAELKGVYTIIWNNRSFKAQPLKRVLTLP